MTDFVWNDQTLELQLVNPSHPTCVPLCGNRSWALIPSNLDGYCYAVDLPHWMRVLKRLGLYLQVDGNRGPLTKVLDHLETFYGANYLRLTGQAGELFFEIKVFPDAEESRLYLTVAAENRSNQTKELKILTAVDFEFHYTPWACKGFTEDATQDYSGPGRKIDTPHDDNVRVEKEGRIFVVSDAKSAGLGFLASEKPVGWTLDRGKFAFETPFNGDQRLQGDVIADCLELSNDATSDDSFCATLQQFLLAPSQQRTVPVVIGYQMQEDLPAILKALKGARDAFEETKAYYQTPLVKGVKIETPDPTINAQFNLYTLFVKLNEHHCGDKVGFLPAAHYFNWVCGDSIMALMGYVYTGDTETVVEALRFFMRSQHPDGFIPNLPLWTDGPSWRERATSPILETVFYVPAACQVIRVLHDRELARSFFPSLQKAMALVLSQRQEGLIVPGGEFSFDAIDWPCGFAHCPQTFMSVAAFKALNDLSELARWLGEPDYAQTLQAAAKELQKTINDKLWLEDRGHYRIGLADGKVGNDERDRELFEREMISWSSLVAVAWGVAEGVRGQRAIQSVKERLLSPYGMKFFDPAWQPAYTDAKGAATYAAGRVQNGAYWHCWWSLDTYVAAQLKLGNVAEGLRVLRDLRLDTIYARFKMREKGQDLSFLRAGEWTDFDMTFPLTSIPYTLTAAFFNQMLLESIMGIQVGFDELQVNPHLPPEWHGATISNLRIGDSEWSIAIRRGGSTKTMLMDGKETPSLPLTPGKHEVQIILAS